tara:strand:- start:229 stop:510 length:282 start_codon:yes stop_codon:yes gene_type:complete
VKNARALRVQVKTTLKLSSKYSYQWSVSVSRPKRSLTTDDCDVVACVAIDTRRCFFVPVSQVAAQQTLRLSKNKMLHPDLEFKSWAACSDLLV